MPTGGFAILRGEDQNLGARRSVVPTQGRRRVAQTESVPTFTRLDPRLRDELEALARKRERTLAGEMRIAVRRHLEAERRVELADRDSVGESR